MMFNVERRAAARGEKREQIVITPLPLDEKSIMKMEEEKAREKEAKGTAVE